MSIDGRDLAEQYYRLMAEPIDVDRLAELYASDALVIRFNGTSAGFDEISEFLAEVAARHRPYELHTIEQFTQVGDVVMWDGQVTTTKGVLETTEVVVLDADGKIKRHIPGIRGYWGM
jgi:SnoaL-like domain